MEAILNNLIKATGWSIFHSLWQGAIIYGVLLLIIAVFPKLNAKAKHNMAYGAMCLIFAGFCITFYSIFKLPENNITTNITGQSTHVLQSEYPLNPLAQFNNRTEHIFPYLVGAYTLGLLLQVIIISVGYKKLQLLKQAERSMVPLEWLQIFKTLVAKLNLRRPISFHLSNMVNVPVVIGFLKPVVLFPVALASQMDTQQIEAILIHELSHIRRNDYLLNLIKTGIETILFFNPFIWLNARFINIEREHACDDMVLKFTGTPVTYAHALLKLEIMKNKYAPVLSMAATGQNQHLYQRIKRITDMKTNYMDAKQQIFAVALTVATVISLAWINPVKTTSDKNIHSKKIKHEKQIIKLNTPHLLKINSISSIKLNDDTTKKKKRFKIVTVDTNGRKQEYNSIKEMPDSLRQEVISETFLNNDDFHFDFHYDSLTNANLAVLKSPEFKKQLKYAQLQAAIIAKQFNSPEGKKQLEELQNSAMAIAKEFKYEDMKKLQKDMTKAGEEMKKFQSSPEFRKQIEEMKKLQSSPEFKKQIEEMKKFQSSPEFKKQIEEMKKLQSSPEFKKQIEEMKKLQSSPEFRKQIKEMKKLQSSPEYKQLKEKFDKDLQKLKEEKGIKSDLKSKLIPTKDSVIIINGQVVPTEPNAKTI